MCILTFIKPSIVADYDALAAGAEANPHGHGWAVHAGDRLVIGHGLDPKITITEFAQARMLFPDGPALFHSRFATHGKQTTANCHPFAIGGDKRSVLAHNGILPEHVHPLPGDDRSDTRIAAEDFLPRLPFGSLDSWTGRTRFERWLDTDKAVILTVDPAFKHPAYIFNEQRGHWRDGCWYSKKIERTNCTAPQGTPTPTCPQATTGLDPRPRHHHRVDSRRSRTHPEPSRRSGQLQRRPSGTFRARRVQAAP
ncbi:class II glutamine amidotransferase domain-containing protein [Nocardia salmonicida]|uniref:hypothetical protein n=1 Tax=Nocardia salmonicida TaxID=53431 RepID=UPI0036B7CBE5